MTLKLAFGLSFADLYSRTGLVRIDRLFLESLQDADVALSNRLLAARAQPESLEAQEESDLLVDLAPHVDQFIGRLFTIGEPLRALQARHHALAPVYACKRLFVQRRAAKKIRPAQARELDGAALREALEARLGGALTQRLFAEKVMFWMDDEGAYTEALDLAANYAAWAVHTEDGRAFHQADVLFKVPSRLDFEHLVPVETVEVAGVRMMRLPEHEHRHREGFALTDPGTDLLGALDQANYCIHCHNQDKDSCAKGLKEKGGDAFAQSPFGVTLAGCPLEERISEMNLVKTRGHAVAALATAVVDNPMCAGTGHRICNDCMKSCIYQKQDPVDIPQIETRALKDVLDLHFGFEVYSLLTRWNPLNVRRPLPRPDSGRSVLVVGLGPAGYTLAHHLMNDGHHVVGIDGLKIEPLPAHLSGVNAQGDRVPFEPVRDVESLREPLDERVMGGFGGVAEYGITVRWDKNFLKVIRLLLERRARFAMFGGVRLGGTITLEDAFAMGFDHVALCMGAGKPTVLSIPGGMAKGVRTASDFLMGLQLTGAARRDSVANMQLRLPAVVIGGGLTAIDTATEALAYYPVQVEKFLARFEKLCAEMGEASVREAWTAEEARIADEFVAHARAIRAERQAAREEGREPALVELMEGWGGVTLAYRRRLIDSPSYTLNHEEVAKAMEEGIRFAELLSPLAIETDEGGCARAVRFARQTVDEEGRLSATGEEVALRARSVLVAAGTQPNTVLAREDASGSVMLDGKYFRAVDEDGRPVTPERLAKPAVPNVLMHVREDGGAVSFFGDLHPSFAGNVVKAMGSAKQGYPVVSRMLARLSEAPRQDPKALINRLNEELRAEVHEVKRLTPTIVEVVVRAPRAARAFRPGQFYRLQNFETLAPRTRDTVLAMEGLALTGAWVDMEAGLIGLIVLEMGGSSNLVEYLAPGEPVVLMGPTGTPTEIPSDETVLLAGGGLGNAVLFSIGQALRAAGSRVLYFAGYRSLHDRYHIDQIEAASDVVVWCCDQSPGFAPTRHGDLTFVGNIVEAMAAYGRGELGEAPISLNAVDRIIAIGSDRMMAAVAAARHGVLASHLKKPHVAIGSINSPMQCMMKEICAQCLQTHRDPETGKEWVVFSCFNQDQPLDLVDFGVLSDRLNQNGVQEKLTAQWIARELATLDVTHGKSRHRARTC